MGMKEAIYYAVSEEESGASTVPVPDRSPPVEPMGNLTRREGEVAYLVARGLTNREISEKLFISERTVDHHVSNILKKLGLHSREQVAASIAE